MLHQETKEETKIVEKVTREWVTCDMCHKEIQKDAFEILDGKVSFATGHNYPDGGNRVTTHADLCAECFKTRLVPWLEGQGVKMQTCEEDW